MYKTLLHQVLSKTITAVVRRKSSLRDTFLIVRMSMTVFVFSFGDHLRTGTEYNISTSNAPYKSPLY